MSHLCLITQKQKPPDFMSEGFFTPEKGVVPKGRVELTRVAPLVFENHWYRFSGVLCSQVKTCY